ncbi:MAG: hypothetical protein V1890_03560 [Candidatus Zixiibacteriota bacterium]
MGKRFLVIGAVMVFFFGLTVRTDAEVPGRELVKNGGFDGGTSGWTAYNVTWITDDGVTSKGCAEIKTPKEGVPASYVLQDIPVIGGKEYQLTLFYKVMNDYLSLPFYYWNDSSGTPIKDVKIIKNDGSEDYTSTHNFTSYLRSKEWREYTERLIAPNNAVSLRIQLTAQSEESILRVEDVSLRQWQKE